MIINEKARKAIEEKDHEALIEALREDYGPEAARYLAGKLLGTIVDDNIVM